MTTHESDTNPFLQGNFAPWRTEGDARNLTVRGAIPRDLNGTLYRNGPNPAFEPLGPYHWFDGDGMIHAVTLEDGRASYGNRWVGSAGLREEQGAGKALHPGLFGLTGTELAAYKNTANTNIVFHAGRLLALMEAGVPTQLSRSLDTLGEYDFGGRLAGPMTAHPKLDPASGEMLFFGYSPVPPYLQYYVADAAGAIVRHEVIDVPWPSMMHDFAVTAEHVIFIVCPLVFSFEDLGQRGGPFTWEPERGTRQGVMPRAGGSADVRWFETDASYVFHSMNAYRDGGEIVLDVVRYPRLLFMNPRRHDQEQFEDDNAARLHRWRVDLAGGTVRSTPLDDRACEFPRIDERRLGHRHRFGYVASAGPEGPESRLPVFTALHKHDLERGRSDVRPFGAGNGISEPLFVPRHAAADEDDGYVLVVAYDRSRDTSEFLVLDARHITAEPLARVELPHRVPYGFHGNWVPA